MHFVIGMESETRTVLTIGAKKYEEVKRAKHTMYLMMLIFSSMVAGCYILFSGQLLGLMQVPEEIMEESISVLWIYALNLPAIALSIVSQSVLNGSGNSKSPMVIGVGCCFTDRAASVEFKIGLDQKYVVKNISSFLNSVQQAEKVRYGKKLEFYHNPDAFSECSKKLISFLKEQQRELQRSTASCLHSYYGYGRTGNLERTVELDMRSEEHTSELQSPQ